MNDSNSKFVQVGHILSVVFLVFSLAMVVSCSNEEHTETLSEMNDTVSEMKDSVSEVNDSVSEVNDSVSEVNDTVSEMKDTVSEMRDTMSEMNDSTSEMSDSVSKMSDSVSGMKMAVKEEVNEAMESVSGMKEAVKEKAQEVMEGVENTVAQLSGDADMEQPESDKPYTVSADGKVDWYTFNGYRRYHSECHVCHGPAGLGSSFAPNLTESVVALGYEGYLEVVVNGREVVNNTSNQSMPSFAANKNVMCYIDDIYAYLVARADGAVGTQRPAKEAKPPEATERDDACI